MGLLQMDMGLLLMDTGLPPPTTGLRLQATGLPQVVPLVTGQPREGCPQAMGRPRCLLATGLHRCPQDTGRHRGVEAQGTQPHVTVMGAVGEEGQHPPMMLLSMFTNSRTPPLQVKTFQQTWMKDN